MIQIAGTGEPAQHPSAHRLVHRGEVFGCQRTGLGEVDLPVFARGEHPIDRAAVEGHRIFDAAGVHAKFGVRRDQIVDYLTLIGDSVDNVPGVKKVGPKTAAKWLQQYATLDELLRHAEEIGGVVGENLRNARDWLPTARTLLAVKRDVALPAAVEQLLHRPPDRARLATLFERCELRSPRRELGEVAAQPAASQAAELPPAPRPAREHETILTQARCDAWLARLHGAALVAVDTETTGLDPQLAQLMGISFSVEPHRAAYLPLAHAYAGAPTQLDFERTLAQLRPWLEDPARPKVGQNAKYEMHIFANHGLRVRGVQHDTCVPSCVVESHKPHDMDSMAQRHLGVKPIGYEEVAGKGAS